MLEQRMPQQDKLKIQQNANCVVMVPPKEFAFNSQTAQDNEFQNQVAETTTEVRAAAMKEFNSMVNQLRDVGVQVVVFDYPVGEVETPDAVFPNNWFSTTQSGTLYTFPMACENRQHEVKVNALVDALKGAKRPVLAQDSLIPYLEQNAFLESTGVMVKDHISRTIYAALSQRCDREVLEDYAQRIGYDCVVSFQTQLPSGKPIYHTNVMMAIGDKFCVICDEVIPEFERRFVTKSLAKEMIMTLQGDILQKFFTRSLLWSTIERCQSIHSPPPSMTAMPLLIGSTKTEAISMPLT